MQRCLPIKREKTVFYKSNSVVLVEQLLVSQHDFIFSNHFRHRAARHAAFIIACWLFFLLSYYIPSGVFPAWNTEKFAGNVARIGLLRWLWLRLINSAVSLLPLLIFAYAVIYFLLPRHLFHRKNWQKTAILFIAMLLLILVAQYFCGWLVSYNWVSADPSRRTMHSPNEIINRNIKIILLNYPVVTGFAVIIKMMKTSWLKQQEMHQIAREKAKAELQLLKGQIHPHFLFNTLNNIYFFTLTASEKATEMLTRLTGILRYILYECSQPVVPLEKEVEMIKDYVELEKIRYGDRLKMEFEINGDCRGKMIPPLILIPLVENSFKHGASKMLVQPWVNLNITVKDQFLIFLLSNSRPNEMVVPQQNSHIGLNNVRKRLQLLYPAAHELNLAETTNSFEVFMKFHVEERDGKGNGDITEIEEYAMA